MAYPKISCDVHSPKIKELIAKITIKCPALRPFVTDELDAMNGLSVAAWQRQFSVIEQPQIITPDPKFRAVQASLSLDVSGDSSIKVYMDDHPEQSQVCRVLMLRDTTTNEVGPFKLLLG